MIHGRWLPLTPLAAGLVATALGAGPVPALSTTPKLFGQAPPVVFASITLLEEDARRVILEDDGDVRTVREGSRRLVRTLTADQLAAFREALRAARPGDWPQGDATWSRGRSRLVVLGADGATRSVGLPSGDPLAQALVSMLRAAAAD